jgi:hypothetical protein
MGGLGDVWMGNNNLFEDRNSHKATGYYYSCTNQQESSTEEPSRLKCSSRNYEREP